MKIVGRFPALQTNTFHQVSIRQRVEPYFIGWARNHQCGGSLIDNRTVLTSAVCLTWDLRKRDARSFHVFGGGVNLIEETPNTFISNVREVIIHESYDPFTSDNNIGLLILETEVDSSHPTLRPIDLATSSPEPGSFCQITGWSGTLSCAPNWTAALMAINTTIETTESCKAISSYYSKMAADGMLCAKEITEWQDACMGEVGAPLVCDGVLAGVSSRGDDFYHPNPVKVYANVAHFREWINQHKSAGSIAKFSVIGVVAACIAHGVFTGLRKLSE